MKFSVLFFLIFCFLATKTTAQDRFDNNDKKYITNIRKATGKIEIDGKIEEEAWKKTDKVFDFWQTFPYDTAKANVKTEVRLCFDDNFLYVSAVCFQPKKYVVVSLKRDFVGGTTDVFGLHLDTFKDKLNAFNFAISPYGVQREGLISGGNELSNDWDNKWYSQVQNYDDRWTVEMAIPFKTLRYKSQEGTNEWLVNFLRFDQSQAYPERSTWAPIPRFQPGSAIAYSGTLIWETPPPKPGANVSVIPYLLGSSDKDFYNKKPVKSSINAGFDAKIAVTPSLNLDLTLNPDFAQVEVDRQVTNLSRFELSFPERRQFFIENADLFSNFGYDNINPFFSRRVGLKNGIKIPILGGMRLSGRLDKNWRLGMLSMQTAAVTDSLAQLNEPKVNYSMLAIQRRVFSRSNIAFVMTNRQNFIDNLKQQAEVQSDYNRMIGLDYNLASKDGRLSGKIFYHRSLAQKTLEGQFAYAAFLQYNSQTWNASGGIEVVGQNFEAQGNAMGYVQRSNYYRTEPNIFYSFYPKSKLINTWNIGTDGDYFWRITDNKALDYDISPVFFGIRFQNSANLRFTPFRQDYTFLFDDFDPTNTGGKKLKAGTEYRYNSARISFVSNNRPKFYYALSSRFGEYFNGNITQLQATLNYRYQPYGVFSVDVNYNKISLPSPYTTATLLLISPRIDLSFSKNVFFSTIVQYNNQRNNMNLNARFQWRFKPVSDLFIVYTENAFASDTTVDYVNYRGFQTKNRALVLKLTYWLNV